MHPTDPNPALLGTLPDQELARRWGRATHAVRAMRLAAGIPAWKRPPESAPMRQFRATDAEYAPVVAYAEAHGCSESEAIRVLIRRP